MNESTPLISEKCRVWTMVVLTLLHIDLKFYRVGSLYMRIDKYL